MILLSTLWDTIVGYVEKRRKSLDDDYKTIYHLVYHLYLF